MNFSKIIRPFYASKVWNKTKYIVFHVLWKPKIYVSYLQYTTTCILSFIVITVSCMHISNIYTHRIQLEIKIQYNGKKEKKNVWTLVTMNSLVNLND